MQIQEPIPMAAAPTQLQIMSQELWYIRNKGSVENVLVLVSRILTF